VKQPARSGANQYSQKRAYCEQNETPTKSNPTAAIIWLNGHIPAATFNHYRQDEARGQDGQQHRWRYRHGDPHQYRYDAINPDHPGYPLCMDSAFPASAVLHQPFLPGRSLTKAYRLVLLPSQAKGP
jgi:hypothetical protein